MKPEDILYEDNHLIAVNKAAGILVQGDKTGDMPLCDEVKDYLKKKYGKPGDVFCGVIHRIDRPVSGAVLFARTSKALVRMNRMVAERHVTKKYWAIVQQRPPHTEETLVHYLKRIEKNNSTIVSDTAAEGYCRAELAYRLAGASDHYFLLEIDLRTGRHHQIRAQLAAIGCPIKGDLKYGAPRSNPDGSISLHARSISFIHPVTQQETLIQAPVPDDKLWHFFETL
ncbi:MAG: RluA family pseudouridine synthase [Bacteroidales bacterium]|nr:RluA family pseudouridine synthase [Bacteroidales bacterium]